jgi:hypothetical protein
VAREQAKVGKKVAYKDLIFGDLIFFGSSNKRSRRISHVGMYIGNGWFAEASSKKRKVVYTNFNQEPKYIKRIKICRRYLSKDEKKFYMVCHGKLTHMETTSSFWTTPWQPGMKIPKKAVP